jgi:hypothetical protein
MPIKYSISGSFFGSASWDNPAIWYGGVVPTASDQVYIQGVRTSINNAPGYYPWLGQQTLIVANTASLPPSGSVYTYTDRDEEIKINYAAISSSNRLLSCSIDTSFYSWSLDIYPITESLPSKKGGIIPNGAFVYFKPGTIMITSSMVISASNDYINDRSALYIYQGGAVSLQSGSTLSLYGRAYIEDGELTATGSALFKFDRHNTTSSDDNRLTYFTGLAAAVFPYQKIVFDGPEVRTNTRLSQSVAVGDAFLTVSSSTGFEVGDHVFVGVENFSQSRTDNGLTGKNISVPSSSYDEVFEVAYKATGSRLYVKRMNGLEGNILATSSATQVIVDEKRFKSGDKVVINGQVRTVTSSSIYELQVGDYDFQGGATLADWETDITRSFWNNDWTLYPGLGLAQFTTVQYRHLFIKNLMLDDVKVEAYVSNLRNITNGSGSRASYGIHIQAEPQSDYDYTGPTTAPTGWPLRTSFVVDPFNARMYLRQKWAGQPVYDSIYTGSFAQDGLKKLTLETENGFVRSYVNDILYAEEIIRSGGATWGRVGLFSDGNNCLICTRFTVKRKCQLLVLDAPTTVVIGDKVIETGAEYAHNTNDRVIKLLSVVTDPAEHVNYAMAYRGAADYATTNPASASTNMSGSFPYIFANNAFGITASKTQDTFNFWRLLPDYQRNFYDYGLNQFTRSVVIDLGQPVTFNSFGFLEDYLNAGQNWTSSRGIQISGSNTITGSFVTASNWVPLTSSFIDERWRASGETFRGFRIGGPHTYRFVRIEWNGGNTRAVSSGYNRIRGLRLRYNVSNSLQLNNTSDMNIGDEVLIISKNNTAYNYKNILDYTNNLFGTTASAAQFVDQMKQHYTIANKSGSMIYLDRPFEDGDLEKGALVVKVNRTMNFSGSMDSGSGNWKMGKIYVAASATPQLLRRIKFNNVAFQHLNYYWPGGGSYDNYGINGFCFRDVNAHNYSSGMTGCTTYNCFNYANYPGYWYYRSGYNLRHNVITQMSYVAFMGIENYNTAPIVITGNVFYGINGTSGVYSNSAMNLFSYNFNMTQDWILPVYNTQAKTNIFNNYTTTMIFKRNKISGTRAQWNAYSYNDNIGSQHFYNIDSNLIEYNDFQGSTIYIYSQVDKAHTNPFLLPKRLGMDANRWNASYYQNQNWSPVINLGTFGTPVGTVGNYIKDWNRWGYNKWTNNYGEWVKLPNDNFYKFYRNSYVGVDYKYPLLNSSFYLADGVSGSFDISFDYYMTKNVVNQGANTANGATATYATGSLYMIALKEGYEMDSVSGSAYFTARIPKSETPINFTRTYQLQGPGNFVIGIGGADFYSGFVAISNISSRLNVPDDDQSQVFVNNLNMRYFDKGDRWLAKTMYTQPINQTKFRLKGARLF